MQVLGKVPERSRCRYLVRFLEGSGADSQWSSGGSPGCRCSVRFWKVRVQLLCEVPYTFNFLGQKHLKRSI